MNKLPASHEANKQPLQHFDCLPVRAGSMDLVMPAHPSPHPSVPTYYTLHTTYSTVLTARGPLAVGGRSAAAVRLSGWVSGQASAGRSAWGLAPERCATSAEAPLFLSSSYFLSSP